jgi:hypothetical protein
MDQQLATVVNRPTTVVSEGQNGQGIKAHLRPDIQMQPH